MFGVFGDSPSSDALLDLDDLSNALGHIRWIRLACGILFHRDHQHGHDMSSYLVIGLNQCSKECQGRVKGRTRNERRVGD